MKRLFTLLALALVINSAIAQQVNSILNLRLSDNSVFTMWVNGSQAGTQGNRVRVEALNPGQHYVQIYRLNSNWGYTSYDNIFSGFVSVPASSELFTTINLANNIVQYDNIVALIPACPAPNVPGNVGVSPQCGTNVNPRNAGYMPNVNNGVGCHSNYGMQVVYEPAPPVVCGPVAMDAQSFHQLKNTIANATFESTKLTVFKQALAYNYFTTAQVRELMCQFTFDSYRLDVAKLAYTKTIDQQNYFLVNNAFTFNSNINDLHQYIASL